jgi:hypothetical protein
MLWQMKNIIFATCGWDINTNSEKWKRRFLNILFCK